MLTLVRQTWTLLYSLDQSGISLNTLYMLYKPHILCASEPTHSEVLLWFGETEDKV